MDKTVFLMRGIPGTGKSTVAEFLVNAAEANQLSYAVHSSDDLRYENGVYNYNAEKNAEVHTQNWLDFMNSLNEEIKVVIVDNTFATREFMKPYIDGAVSMGYAVRFVEMQHLDPQEAEKRTIHNAPLQSIQRMLGVWEPSQSSPIEELSKNLEEARKSANIWSEQLLASASLLGASLDQASEYRKLASRYKLALLALIGLVSFNLVRALMRGN